MWRRSSFCVLLAIEFAYGQTGVSLSQIQVPAGRDIAGEVFQSPVFATKSVYNTPPFPSGGGTRLAIDQVGRAGGQLGRTAVVVQGPCNSTESGPLDQYILLWCPACKSVRSTDASMGGVSIDAGVQGQTPLPALYAWNTFVARPPCPPLPLKALWIDQTTAPANDSNDPYGGALVASGGVPPYTYAVTSGALPAGLALSPMVDGGAVISGVPTSSGMTRVAVTTTDSTGAAVTTQFTITVR